MNLSAVCRIEPAPSVTGDQSPPNEQQRYVFKDSDVFFHQGLSQSLLETISEQVSEQFVKSAVSKTLTRLHPGGRDILEHSSPLRFSGMFVYHRDVKDVFATSNRGPSIAPTRLRRSRRSPSDERWPPRFRFYRRCIESKPTTQKRNKSPKIIRSDSTVRVPFHRLPLTCSLHYYGSLSLSVIRAIKRQRTSFSNSFAFSSLTKKLLVDWEPDFLCGLLLSTMEGIARQL